MLRLLTLAAGFAGAFSLSQFPEYSQQYMQRLAGAVDELRAIVVAFDATAAAANLTREEALADLSATPFQTELQAALAGQITRYETLAADYHALRAAEPMQRLAQVYRFTDTDLARRTWEDFRPAVPASTDGLICAALGFLLGWGLLSALGGLLRSALTRRPKTEKPVA